ncbi:MAG: hypothetical protein IT273_14585 [Chitinophagales bacterium]|nr:hypothetical protein [Chitinophagales bacterium]
MRSRLNGNTASEAEICFQMLCSNNAEYINNNMVSRGFAGANELKTTEDVYRRLAALSAFERRQAVAGVPYFLRGATPNFDANMVSFARQNGLNIQKASESGSFIENIGTSIIDILDGKDVNYTPPPAPPPQKASVPIVVGSIAIAIIGVIIAMYIYKSK